MGIGVAFAQGFADRAIQRRDEDRRAQYEELLRQRELADWKTKEVFKGDLEDRREESLYAKTQKRDEAERERKRLARRESLQHYGISPQFIDAFDGMEGVTESDILKHWQTHDLDEDGKTIRPKDEIKAKRQVKSASQWVERYGYKGTQAEAIIIGLAEKTEDFMNEFYKNFKVDKNGNVTPISEITAGIRADASGSNFNSWQNKTLEDGFSDIVYTPLAKLLGNKIQIVKDTNRVTGETSTTLKAQDAPGFYEWKGKVFEAARRNIQQGMSEQAAMPAAIREVGMYKIPKPETGKGEPDPSAGDVVIPPPDPKDVPVQPKPKITDAQRRAQDIVVDRLTQMSDEEFGKIPENEIEPHIVALKQTNPTKARELAERWDKLNATPEMQEYRNNKQTRDAFNGYLSMDAKQLALVPPDEMKPVLEKMRSVDPKRVAKLEEKYSKARTLP